MGICILSKDLSMLLSVCLEYGVKHDIKYNSTNSNTMIFCCTKLKDIDITNIVLNNEPLSRADQWKYLGHFMSEDVCGDVDMSGQSKRMYFPGNALTRQFSTCLESVKTTMVR